MQPTHASIGKNYVRMNVWWEVIVLTWSLKSQEGDMPSKKMYFELHVQSMTVSRACKKWAFFSPLNGHWQLQQEQQARTDKQQGQESHFHARSPALPWRNAGLSLSSVTEFLCDELHNCARDVTVPYLQDYFKDECIEGRASQIVFLALGTVLAEHIWYRKRTEGRSLCFAKPVDKLRFLVTLWREGA